MKVIANSTPRTFEIDASGGTLQMKDCGRIELEPNELVVFDAGGGAEYEVTRKDWGFYATPSTNGRLRNFGLRTALVTNRSGRLYVLLVRTGHEIVFHGYLKSDRQQLVCWLDSDEAVNQAVERLTAP